MTTAKDFKKIDFHSHYLTPAFVKYLDDRFGGYGDGVKTPEWSVAGQLKLMAEQNIDYALLSISSPQVNTGDEKGTLALAQEVNEFGGQFHADHADKLGFMASLPMPYVDASVREVANALDNDHASGFVLESNSAGVYLGDPLLDPVMQALDDRHALVVMHPTQPEPLNPKVTAGTANPLMEFFFDTTRSVVNLSEHKMFSRYPNITWVIPHAGALLPIIAQRITIGSVMLNQKGTRDNLMALLGHVYFDVAGMVLPYQLPTLLQLADPAKLVYGADYPYTPEKTVITLADQLATTGQLSAAMKANIFYNNGDQLLTALKLR